MALEAVQAQAGHASIESTRVYLQATSPARRHASCHSTGSWSTDEP